MEHHEHHKHHNHENHPKQKAEMDHSKMDHSGHNPAHGEMGHDHHKMMIEDFKRRFWVSTILTIPIIANDTELVGRGLEFHWQ